MKIGLIQGIEVLKALFVLHVNLKYTFNQILFGSVCSFNNIPVHTWLQWNVNTHVVDKW